MRERTIFMAALDLDDATSQAAFIDRECNGDTALKARIEALLHSHRAAGSFLHGQPFVSGSAETVVHHPAPEGPGTVIGPYKLLQGIGEGGMGTVYLGSP
jgi:hypothetical protein